MNSIHLTFIKQLTEPFTMITTFEKGDQTQTLKNKKMITKKTFRTATLVMLMAIALPASSAILAPENSIKPATTENARSQQLVQRLEELKSMDKSEMTRLEKKAMRKEVFEIKKEMKVASGGVYLSIGAIIIVILLLILLL